MKAKLVTAFLFSALAAACGTDDPLPPAFTDPDVPTARDVVSRDTGGHDVADDAGVDTEADAAEDTVADVTPDTVPDATPDAAPDVIADAVPDVVPDVVPDATPDVVPDVTPDVVPDVEPDADPDVPPPAGCGNGVVELGEECDDGNRIDNDACSNDCREAFCGDGTMNEVPGTEVFGSPEVDAFGIVANVCDDGASCPAGVLPGVCDVSDISTAPEHGICAALGYEFASNVEWGGGEGAGGAQTHHAYNWECFEYTCVESPFALYDSDCSDFEMLSSIECFGIVREECDDGELNADAPDACRLDCTLPYCMDGIVDSGEECDDGNRVNDDGCSNECLLPQCGDGVVNGDEECDDGDDDDTNDCLNDCRLPTCGDGVVSDFLREEMHSSPIVTGPTGATGHVCDDGATCFGPRCDVSRNGSATEHGICEALGYDQTIWVTWGGGAGESDPEMPHAYNWLCSDFDCGPSTNTYDRDNCSSFEMLNEIMCFGGYEEACDEGEDNSDEVGATCRTDCTLPRCGDGVLEEFRGEECDDGNDIPDDGCSNICRLPQCGDAVIQGDEECDDGDEIDTNGCRNDCTLQICGDGFLADAEECDDGELNSDAPDASCRPDCLFPRCGDGIVDTGEFCDDGNDNERDLCPSTCEEPYCGDGFVQPLLGEECDDANDDDEDTCRNDCTFGPLHVPTGCSEMATWSYEIAPDFWICSFNTERGKTWEETWGVCNEEAGYYLPSVGSMTRRGLPTDDEIGPAMRAASAHGHDYITTGHPARSCDWEGTDYEVCNGLGYVNTGETTGTGSNWVALTDGNTSGRRSWPAANTTGAHPLGSFCLNALADPDAVVFDHRWQ